MTTAVDHAARLLGDRARRDVPLGPLTTYRVGGSAARFVRLDTEDDLVAVSRAVAESGVDVLVVGRGSNLLVADEGFEGLALALGPVAEHLEFDGSCVWVGAGVALPVLARRTVAAGLTGMEWAVGVPGTVGGAVRMNAGGHGSDMAACLVEVEILDLRTGQRAWRSASDLGLRFRGSSLRDHDLVVAARLDLAPGDRTRGEAELADIVRWRREHQPGGQNAGSVFVNPVPGAVAAGQLIDAAGLRGVRHGTAQVSTKHANFIQADEGGRAADVVALMVEVRRRVGEMHGVWLRSEIRLVGFQAELTELFSETGA